MVLLRRVLVLWLLAAGMLAVQARGQSPLAYPYDVDIVPPRGIQPAADYISDAVGNIEVTNGKLFFEIPLAPMPAGRGGSGFSLSINYDSHLYNMAPVWDGEILQTIYPHSPPAGGSPGGWRYNIQAIGPRVDYRRLSSGTCSSMTDRRQYIAWFVLPDGSPHLLHLRGAGDERHDGYVGDGFYDTSITGYSQCGPSQTGGRLTYYTADGTFLKLEVEATGAHSNPYTSWNYPANGQHWTLYYPDGRRIEGNGRKTTALIDANGNRLSVANHYGEPNAYTSITDDFGRTVRIDFENGYDVITAPSVATWIVYWAALASPGTNRWYACGIEAACSVDLGGLNVVTAIALPPVNGVRRYWTFGYSPSASAFGELNQIFTPEGAEHRYAYAIELGLEGAYAPVVLGYNAVGAAQVIHDGKVDSWNFNYAWGGAGTVSTAVTAPDLGVLTYSYAKPWEIQNPSRGLVTDIESSSGVSVNRQWTQNRAYGVAGGQNVSPNNPFVRLAREKVQGDTLLSAPTEFRYDKNGNLLRSTEYDWVEGTSGAGGILRDVQRTYAVDVGEFENTADDANAYWAVRGSQGCSGSLPVLRLDALQREVISGNGGPQAATEFGYGNIATSCPLTNGNVAEIRQWDNTKSPGLPSGPLSAASAVIVAQDYDGFGNITAIRTPASSAGGNPLTTSFTYDPIVGSSGPGPYATKVIHGSGAPVFRSSTLGWEPLTGTRTSGVEDQSQVATSFAYNDPFQRPTAVDEPGRHTSVLYDDASRRAIVTAEPIHPGDPERKTIVHFDQLGREVLVQTPDGAPIENENDGIKVETIYDGAGAGGRVVTSSPYRRRSDATLEWTCVQYDRLGRVAAVGLFAGPAAPANCETSAIGVTHVTYGTGLTVDGRWTTRVQTTDPANRTREEYRDAAGNLIEVVEHPDASTSDITLYTYDAVGNLRSVSQGVQTRAFEYTSLGWLAQAFNPETGTIHYEYYDSGNLKTRTDGRPAVTTYAYDALGRLTDKTYSGLGGVTPSVNYGYGSSGLNAGRLVSVSSSAGTDTYSYDLLGRVSASTQTITGAGSYAFAYEYWPNDVLKSVRYPSGKTIEYGADSAGRPNKASTDSVIYADLTPPPGVNPAPVFYTPDGRIAQMKLGNGLWDTRDFRAPSMSDPERFMLGPAAGNGSLVNLQYRYLVPGEPWDGNVKSVTTQRDGGAWRQHFFYDRQDRLQCVIEAPERPAGCGAPNAWTESFGYDRYGNRWVTASSQQNRDAAHEPRFAADFDPSTNRLTDARLTGIQYDEAGNLTGFTPRTLVYDAENRLIAVKLTATGETLGSFVYDGNGRRIAKTWSSSGESQTTYYVYNINGQLAAEYTTTPITSSSRSYVFADMLGSVRAITSETGAITECHDYLPFGEELSFGDGAPGNTRDLACYTAASVASQKFTGQQRDGETGLDYFRARYYSPSQGRFTSPDEPFADQHLEDPKSWNLYGYVRNNPLNYTDPSGRCVFALVDTALCAAVALVAIDVANWYYRWSAETERARGLAQERKRLELIASSGNRVDPRINIDSARQIYESTTKKSVTHGLELARDGAGIGINAAVAVIPPLAAAKAAAQGPVIIGETMARIQAAAAKYPDAKILNDMPDFRAMGMTPEEVTSAMMEQNRRWILEQIRSGRQIIDIGPDPNRAVPSIFYQMEQSVLKNYQALHPDFRGVIRR